MLDEKDILCKVLYKLWFSGRINNSSLELGLDNVAREDINKAFVKVQKLGLGDIEVLLDNKLTLTKKQYKGDYTNRTLARTDFDIKIWQTLIDLNFNYINQCPKDILDKVTLPSNLKKTIDIGVFEGLNLKDEDYYKVNNDEIKIFLKMFTFGDGDPTPNMPFSVSHFYKCGILAEDVEPTLRDMELKDLVTNTYKEGVRIESVRCVDSLKAWQMVLDYDFSYIKGCPEHIARKLGYDKLKNVNTSTGIFENKNIVESDLLTETLYLLWLHNKVIKSELLKAFKNDGYIVTNEQIHDIFEKIHKMKYCTVEMIARDKNQPTDLQIVYKESNEMIDNYYCKTDLDLWQTILDLNFEYISRCPKPILEKLSFKNSLKKTVNIGVFESKLNDEEFLKDSILKMYNYDNELFPQKVAEKLWEELTIKNKLMYPKDFLRFKIEIYKIFQKLAANGILYVSVRDDDGIHGARSGYYLMSKLVSIWKKTLENNPEMFEVCPKEILKEIKPNMQKAKNYGVFENTSFRELLETAPQELRDIVWQQWKAPQNPKYHPEGNTFKHIMTVVNRAINKYPNNINLILAAFFHDLGKFKSLGWKNGVPTQHGHEDISTELVLKFADWIRELGGDVEEIKYIVSNHMKIKPDTWNVMRKSKKDKIMQDPAYKNLLSFGDIDKGGLTTETYDVIDYKDIQFDYTDYSLNESTDDDFNPEFVPELSGELVDKDKIERFMFAGKAIFTVRNNQTMNRFTFRVVKPKKIKDDVYFVSVLTGGDNNSMYSFFGTIFNKNVFKVSAKKAKIGLDSQSIKVFQWFFNTLISDKPFPPQIQVWHEGVCGKCGKKLTVPESVDIGLGPICARSAQLWERSQRLVQTNNKTGIFDNFNFLSNYQTFESKDEKKDKMKQLEHDWQEIYKLQKKVVAALRKVKNKEGYGDEFSKNPFEDKIKEVLSKFDISALKIKGIGTGYEVSFKIGDNKFKYEFFTNGKLKDAFEGEQKVNEATVIDDIFLGKKLGEVKDLIDSFKGETCYKLHNSPIVAVDEFVTLNDAETYLKSQGYSIGKMQGDAPIGAKLGVYDIQKWRNLGEDAILLDAIIVNIDNTVFVLYFNFPEI